MTPHEPVPRLDAASVVVRSWFPAVPESVSAAREWATRALEAQGVRLGEEASVMLSELVTNAVTHADGEGFSVAIDFDGRLVVAVCDPSALVPPWLGPPEVSSVSGRGLQIVDRLADGWGVELRSNGKCVWFRTEPPPPSR